MSRQTFCRVTITTPDLAWSTRPGRVLRWSGKPGDELDTLIAVQVGTSLHLGGNSFTLQFAPENFERESIADLVPTNSLVQIEMGSSDHDDDPTVLVGLTSEPVETEVFTPAGPQRAITIPGRGLDSVLAEAGIYRNAALSVLGPAALKTLSEDLFRVVGPATEAAISEGTIATWMGMMWVAGIDPREAIARVLYYFVSAEASTIINLRLPGSRALADLLTAGGVPSTDPGVRKWAKDFGDAVELAKKSGKDQAKKMVEAAKFRCPVPGKWTLLESDFAIPTVSINPAAGSILDIIQGAADSVFHELYAVHQQGRCDVMFGAKPFVRPDKPLTGSQFDATAYPVFGMPNPALSFGQDIETVEIITGDMRGQQSLRRGLPVSNLWHVLAGAGAPMDATAMKNMALPAVSGAKNYSDFMRYGLRPREVSTPYWPDDLIAPRDGADATQQVTKAKDLIDRLNRTLKAWEDPHPVMWHGSLTVAGRSAFKPGRRLVWRGQDYNGRPDGRPTREFYIEGASHTYQCANGDYTTGLQVTRGWELPEGM